MILLMTNQKEAGLYFSFSPVFEFCCSSEVEGLVYFRKKSVHSSFYISFLALHFPIPFQDKKGCYKNHMPQSLKSSTLKTQSRALEEIRIIWRLNFLVSCREPKLKVVTPILNPQ